MVKKTCLVLILLFTTLSFGADDYNKDIVVKDQSRNDKVKTVFREMMNAYEEEDIEQFFSFVSEDRFEQDYMTFYEAIDEDIRVYDILNIDTWVNKITDDDVKRFLYVKWDKKYLSTSSDTEIDQAGYSRFLFDEVNGKYKLIELAGNNFWGGSLPEWTEEVPQIAGQVSKADLLVTNLTCSNEDGMDVQFELENQGEVEITGEIAYKIIDNAHNGSEFTGVADEIGLVELDNMTAINCDEDYDITVIVDPENKIIESDEDNNQFQKTGYNDVARPDLLVENISCSASSIVAFEIVNNGDGEVSGDIEYRITNNISSSTAVSEIADSIGDVSTDVSNSINCYNSYDITVIVDQNNKIKESDESNNDARKVGNNTVAPPPEPDLSPANFSASSFDIQNNSSVDITDSIEWVVKCGASEMDLGFYSDGLSANSSTNIFYNATSCLQPLVLIIDPNNNIEESDENNNEASFQW